MNAERKKELAEKYQLPTCALDNFEYTVLDALEKLEHRLEQYLHSVGETL